MFCDTTAIHIHLGKYVQISTVMGFRSSVDYFLSVTVNLSSSIIHC